MNKKIHIIARYASAPALVAAACIIRYVIIHVVGDDFPTWITFYPTIMLVALMAGFWPGILATVTAVLAVCTFFPPARFGINNAVSIGFFISMGVFMSTAAWLYRRTRMRLEDLLAKLRQTNDELRRENCDRKLAEEKLRNSEYKFSILFSKGSLPTVLSRLSDQVFVDVNDAWTQLFGYTKEESIGKTSIELGITRDLERQTRMYDEIRRNNQVLNLEQTLYSKSGTAFAVMTNSNMLEIGGQVYALTSVQDITERKRLEQQLLQSQKMESVGILAGGVAHDFNNLLTAISGYGQILQESIPEDDELSQESITNVLNAADRASELTRGLLAFSRKQVISAKPVRIDSLISDTSKLIQRIIGEDIEFSTNFTVKNLLVKADPGQIEQILMNLATNARDAMSNGGHLSITTSQVAVEEGLETQYDLPSPGKYALISVSDTGMGIDKKTLEIIFEPFFTTKEVGKGTGLGLAIVHGIIKQHNGSVLARSELGKGTTFDIYLPLVKGHAVKEELKITSPHPGGTETLLVAEDDKTVRMFMKRILERAGYKVIIADDGEDAVVRFREHDDISLVLSDVVMPRKNGKEMQDEIRKIKPGIKIVFISGYAADVIQKKGMFEEGTEFITKPLKKEKLLQKVREVLDKG